MNFTDLTKSRPPRSSFALNLYFPSHFFFLFSHHCSELATLCDVLTVEIEHVNCDILADLDAKGVVKVQPSPKTIAVVQDKHAQKEHFKEVCAYFQ